MGKLIRTSIVVVLSAVIGVAYITGCGGSSSSRTINLGGVIMAPTVSGNIAVLKAAPTEAATQTTCHIYTIQGEDLGEFTSAADGSFSVAVSLDELKGSDEAGTTWTEPVIIDCENAIQLYSEVSIDEDSLADKDLGTANFQTTLAALTLANNVSGFSGWGASYSDSLTTYDAVCLAEVMTAFWNNSAIAGEGLADDNGVIKEVVMALFAAGGSASTYGYASWSDLIIAILGKTISEANWSAIAASVATTLGVSEATLTGYYSTLNSALDAIDSLLIAQFTSGAYGAINICDNVKDDTLDTDALIKPILASDDTTKLIQTYGSEAGIMSLWGILEKCVTDETCADVGDKASAYYGFLNSYAEEGTFANLWNGTTFSSEALGGTLLAAAGCGGTTWAALEECGRAMYGTVYDGAGGWSYFQTSGAFDDSLFDYWSGFYTGAITDGTFVDTTLYYETTWDSYDSYMDDTSIVDCVLALYAAGNYDTSSCYETVSEDAADDDSDDDEIESVYPTDIAGSYYYDTSMDGGCDFIGSIIINSPMTFTAGIGTSFNAAISITSQTIQFSCSYSSGVGIADCDYSSGGSLFSTGDYIQLYFWNSGAEKATMFIDGSLEGGLYSCMSDSNYQGRVYSTQ